MASHWRGPGLLNAAGLGGTAGGLEGKTRARLAESSKAEGAGCPGGVSSAELGLCSGGLLSFSCV